MRLAHAAISATRENITETLHYIMIPAMERVARPATIRLGLLQVGRWDTAIAISADAGSPFALWSTVQCQEGKAFRNLDQQCEEFWSGRKRSCRVVLMQGK